MRRMAIRRLNRRAHGHGCPVDVIMLRIRVPVDRLQRNRKFTLGFMKWSVRIQKGLPPVKTRKRSKKAKMLDKTNTSEIKDKKIDQKIQKLEDKTDQDEKKERNDQEMDDVESPKLMIDRDLDENNYYNVTIRNRSTYPSYRASLYGKLYVAKKSEYDPKDGPEEGLHEWNFKRIDFHPSNDMYTIKKFMPIDGVGPIFPPPKDDEQHAKKIGRHFVFVAMLTLSRVKSRFVADTNFARGKNPDADFFILSKNKEFHVHKSVLSIHTSFVSAALRDGFIEQLKKKMELNLFSKTDVNNFLQAIYPCKSFITNNNVGRLLEVSDFLTAPAVHNLCERFLISDQCKLSVYDKMYLAEKHNLKVALGELLRNLRDEAVIDKLLPEANSVSDVFRTILDCLYRKKEQIRKRSIRMDQIRARIDMALLKRLATVYPSKPDQPYKKTKLNKNDFEKYRSQLMNKYGSQVLNTLKENNFAYSSKRLRHEARCIRAKITRENKLKKRRKARAARRERLKRKKQEAAIARLNQQRNAGEQPDDVRREVRSQLGCRRRRRGRTKRRHRRQMMVDDADRPSGSGLQPVAGPSAASGVQPSGNQQEEMDVD